MCGCSIHNWHSLSDSSNDLVNWMVRLTVAAHSVYICSADTGQTLTVIYLPKISVPMQASGGCCTWCGIEDKRVHLWDECQIVEQPHGSPISTCHRQLNTALAEQTQLHISMRRSLPRSTLAPCVVEHDQSCTKGVHIAQRHWIGSIQYMFRRFPLHTMNANIRY